MRIIGMILTGLIFLLSIVYFIYKINKEEMNAPLLIILYSIMVSNGIVFLILLGLYLKL